MGDRVPMASKRPNILMIVADQLRVDCVGYAGLRQVHTPHIDQLARAGMQFTQAYSHIPLCSPARQSLLCGRRPESFGGLWNYNNGLKIQTLAPTEPVWPQALAQSGYRSGYVGKWNVHPQLPPTAFGYDAYVGDVDYHEYRAAKYPDVAYTNGYFGEVDPLPLEDTETHWLAARACEMVRVYAANEEPWHVRIDFAAPHLPCRPAQSFAQLYDPDDVEVWGSFAETFADKPYIQRQQLYSWGVETYSWAQWAPIVARYHGIISQMDDAIGRILTTLEETGAAEDTVVVFTADHGDLCGGHRMMDKHYVLYDDVVHVPLVIKWPSEVAAGSVCDAFVYNFLDLSPTLLEWADAGPLPDMHGRALTPLLREAQPVDWRTAIVSTYNGQQFGLYTQRMLRTRDWKYIWNTTDTDELYDLRQDPNELVNLIAAPRCQTLVAQMRKTLYDTLAQEGDGLVGSEWMRRQLLQGRKL